MPTAAANAAARATAQRHSPIRSVTAEAAGAATAVSGAQNEVGARCGLRRGKAGEPAVRRTGDGPRRLLTVELLGGAAAPARKRASRSGECLGGGARGAVRD